MLCARLLRDKADPLNIAIKSPNHDIARARFFDDLPSGRLSHRQVRHAIKIGEEYEVKGTLAARLLEHVQRDNRSTRISGTSPNAWSDALQLLMKYSPSVPPRVQRDQVRPALWVVQRRSVILRRTPVLSSFGNTVTLRPGREETERVIADAIQTISILSLLGGCRDPPESQRPRRMATAASASARRARAS